MDDQKNSSGQPRPTPTPPASSAATGTRRRQRVVPIIVGLLIVAGALAWWHPWNRSGTADPGSQQEARQGGGRRGGGPNAMNMPQPVHVATVTQGEMPVVINSLGTVTPLANVTVKTQLNGILTEVHFRKARCEKRRCARRSTRDPTRFRCATPKARSRAAANRVSICSVLSDAAFTGLHRQAVGGYTQASLVKQYEGAVTSDQANVDTYKLDLTYARITAPVSGRVRLRQVDPTIT